MNDVRSDPDSDSGSGIFAWMMLSSWLSFRSKRLRPTWYVEQEIYWNEEGQRSSGRLIIQHRQILEVQSSKEAPNQGQEVALFSNRFLERNGCLEWTTAIQYGNRHNDWSLNYCSPQKKDRIVARIVAYGSEPWSFERTLQVVAAAPKMRGAKYECFLVVS